MTREQALFIQNAVEMINEDIEVTVIPDYSGRGMMGQTTYAVACYDVIQMFSAVINSIRESVPDVTCSDIPEMGNFRTDNLGRQTVIY